MLQLGVHNVRERQSVFMKLFHTKMKKHKDKEQIYQYNKRMWRNAKSEKTKPENKCVKLSHTLLSESLLQ